MTKPAIISRTVYYADVEFVFSSEVSDSDRYLKITEHAKKLAKQYDDVYFDSEYRTQGDGHSFYGSNQEHVLACAKASAAYVARFKGIINYTES